MWDGSIEKNDKRPKWILGEGEFVGFSGEKLQPDELNRARLTFNPWYDEQLVVILEVMGVKLQPSGDDLSPMP